MTPPKGNPQLEHGHTRLANELLEALIRYPFNGGELKVVLAVIRLTYGWHRRRSAIRQTDLARATDLSDREIRRVLAGLRQQGVLFRDRVTRPHTFQINKAYPGWRDWPSACPPDNPVRPLSSGCELSAQADKFVRVAEDNIVLPYKEKKENVLPPAPTGGVHNDPAVENLLQHFTVLLKRPLDAEEDALVRRLHALSPAQAQSLLEQVASSSPQPPGGTDGTGTPDSRG